MPVRNLETCCDQKLLARTRPSVNDQNKNTAMPGQDTQPYEGDGGDCAARTLDQDPDQYIERESGEGGPEKQRLLGLGLRFLFRV